MADRITQALMGSSPYGEDEIMRMAQRPDPVREYLLDQRRQAFGDAGSNAGKAFASGVGGLMSGNPILGALFALGFGGRGVNDFLDGQKMGAAADAFGRTGLPGAPTGPQLPLPADPMMGAGRFADPRLAGR